MAPALESAFSIRSILSEAAELQDQMMRVQNAIPSNPSTPPSSSSSSFSLSYSYSTPSFTSPTFLSPSFSFSSSSSLSPAKTSSEGSPVVNAMSASSTEQSCTTMPPSSLSRRTSTEKSAVVHKKPIYAFNSLIYMAICSNPIKGLLLGEIRDWIVDNFPFYKKKDPIWNASLRHTLTKNKLFKKVARGNDDPGRGSYWILTCSPDSLTVGESTGRLRQNNIVSNGFNAAGPMRSQASGHFDMPHPYHTQYAIHNGIPIPQYYAPNAVYFPTPEEDLRNKQALLQQQQLEQQVWTNFHLLQQQPFPLYIPLQNAMQQPSHLASHLPQHQLR